MYYSMLTRSPFDGYLDYLRFLTIIHKAVINISEKSILVNVPWAFEKNVAAAVVGWSLL